VKERLSCNGFSQTIKHGCTTLNLQPNVKAWSENTRHAEDQEVQNLDFSWPSGDEAVLEL
jgi:hypothetical protein